MLDGPGSVANTLGDQEVLEIFRLLYASYRTLCPRRELLRREVPVGVFLHAAVACYIANREPLPDLRSAIERLGSDIGGPIIYRKSKNFEATISIKS
jgi:hypothetical protein